MRIAFLACQGTLPGPHRQRTDAFEHDLMMECLGAALDGPGDAIEAVSWDDEAADWSDFDAVLVGTTWDYQDRIEEFFSALERISAATPLFNPLPLLRWNSRKSYLRDLDRRGAPIVPTLWLDMPDRKAIAGAFDRLDTDRIVVKRQTGANAEGQYRLDRGDPLPALSTPMMAQPFLAAVQAEGEWSFVFIDGEFSHALIKRPVDGDYRVQSTYGGLDAASEPEPADVKTASSTLALLDQTPLYARVDMVRDDARRLRLMELEMIEPFLYPRQSPELGPRLRDALARRLND